MLFLNCVNGSRWSRGKCLGAKEVNCEEFPFSTCSKHAVIQVQPCPFAHPSSFTRLTWRSAAATEDSFNTLSSPNTCCLIHWTCCWFTPGTGETLSLFLVHLPYYWQPNSSDTTQRLASSCMCCGVTAVPIVHMPKFDYITHLSGGFQDLTMKGWTPNQHRMSAIPCQLPVFLIASICWKDPSKVFWLALLLYWLHYWKSKQNKQKPSKLLFSETEVKAEWRNQEYTHIKAHLLVI